MAEPRVAVVILNTNKRDDTLACLDSLARSTWTNLDRIVLDNASTDGSVEAIEQAHADVHVARLGDNRGYAGNNNVGVALAIARGADWVFVLNEDTVLDPGCIEQMVRYGDAHPEVGIVGPLVLHYSEPGIIQSAGGWFHGWNAGHRGQNEVDRGQFAEPQVVQWISGCGILLRRAVIEQVGMLDERFFYYWEETEWCLRARHAGWAIALVPAARLWHKGVTRDYQPSPNVSYYNTRNRLLMMRTHGASPARLGLEMARTFRMLATWALRPKWRTQREHRRAVVQGLYDFTRGRWGQRVLGAVALAVGLSAGPFSTEARAQAPDRPPDSIARVGPFSIDPAFVFSSGYDTNPWRESGADAVYNTFETYVTPQAAAWLRLNHLRLDLFGAVEVVKAGEAVASKNHQFGSNVVWDSPALAPYLQITSKHTNANPTGFEVGRKSMRNENDIKTGMNWKIGSALTAQGFARLTKTDWDADALYQTSSLREKLNRNDSGFGAGFAVALTPLTSIGVSVERNKSEFVYSPVRNGSGYRVGGSMGLTGSAIVNGNVELGIRQFTSASSNVSFRGLYGNVGLSKTLPTETTVGVRFERDLQFSYDTSLAYFIGQSTTVTIVQPVGDSIALQAGAGRHQLKYDRIAAGEPLDFVSEYSVVLGRKFREHTWVGVSAEWANAKGAAPWDQQRTIVFLTFGSGQFQRLDRPIPFQH